MLFYSLNFSKFALLNKNLKQNYTLFFGMRFTPNKRNLTPVLFVFANFGLNPSQKDEISFQKKE